MQRSANVRGRNTCPSVKIPSINIPSIYIPGINVPSINVPSIYIPAINVPSINIPSINVPSVNIPFINYGSEEEYSEEEYWNPSMSPHQAEAVAVVPNNGPSTGTPQAVIDNLPTYIMKGKDHEECLICLDDFPDGVEVCHLPCMHRFHAPCIQTWLTKNSTCPVCANSILET